MSENCGGVVEPMLAGVPVIAGRVGGLPEVVLDGLTGTTVPVRNPAVLAQEVMKTLGSEVSARAMATTARALVEAMFDIKRTAREVFEIYARILNPGSGHPVPFDSKTFLKQRQPKRVSPTYA
jgi:glycosyltransferase involved in cell wall biosynthesis